MPRTFIPPPVSELMTRRFERGGFRLFPVPERGALREAAIEGIFADDQHGQAAPSEHQHVHQKELHRSDHTSDGVPESEPVRVQGRQVSLQALSMVGAGLLKPLIMRPEAFSVKGFTAAGDRGPAPPRHKSGKFQLRPCP